MKTRLLSYILLTAATVAPAMAEDTTVVVEHLLKQIEQSGLVFIRNGNEHQADEAAAHMRKKYEHFKKDIKTPEDFIRLSATKSLISKKPYKVRLKDGREQPTSDYLLQLLAAHRKHLPDEGKPSL